MSFFNDPTAYVIGYDDGRGVKIPAKEFRSGGVTSWNDLTDKPFGEVVEYEKTALVSGAMGQWSVDSNNIGSISCDATGHCHENAVITAEVDIGGGAKQFSVSGVSKRKSYWNGNVGNIYYDYIGNPALTAIGDGTDTGEDWCAYFEYIEIDNKTKFYFLAIDQNWGGVTQVIEAAIEVPVEKTVPIDSVYLPKAEAVADVTDAPTAEEFNTLLANLRAAGYLEQ